MSAREHPGPEGRRQLGPRADREPAPLPESAALALAQEKVLGEITHELGNFFHKLYYWAEYLRDAPARSQPDASAAQMLEGTIRGLEDFLKVTLGYFSPIALSPVRMTAADVVDGLLFQVRTQINGTPIEVAHRTQWNGAVAMVDPGHVSRAFEIAVCHLARRAGPESRLVIRCEQSARRDCAGIEIEFDLEHPNDPSPLFRTAEAGLEWAVAERILALHGGELGEHARPGGTRHVSVFLPLQLPIED